MKKSELLKLCSSFAGATQEVLWEKDLVFKVGGKMFFCTGIDEEADDPFSFKVDDDRFLPLTNLPGIIPAPYLARAKWVQVDPKACAITDTELASLVADSHRLVLMKLSKKQQNAIRAET